MTEQTKKLRAVPFHNVHLGTGFWAQRQDINRTTTIPAIQYQMEKRGDFEAWKLQWKPGQPHKPHNFWDSDTGKWVEAVGYSLATHPDPELERQVDALIDVIAEAQREDGYINIYYSTVEPGKEWTNLRDMHELYCAGHMIEGAVAYAQATGKTKLLDIMVRYTKLIDSLFGAEEGKRRGYCGHPEIELALVKLYHATDDERFLKLSKYFVDERGTQPHYFDIEALERGDDPAKYWATSYQYMQAHVPVREQHKAVGHSVRACYLYAGMADVAAETGDQELLEVCRELWDDVTRGKLYITGGIGPAHAHEGFTFDYDLPNETAYAETCASISLVFWAHRMFQLDPDSRYIDVLEQTLFNGIMSGVSNDGREFFYANPLASYPNVNPHEPRLINERHYRREEWFSCACCPPNLARLVASIGEYFYAVSSDSLYVNLYGSSSTEFELAGSKVQLQQETNYPWDETISLTLTPEQPTTFTVALRIPEWCRGAQLSVNGLETPVTTERGYARINREWSAGDQVTLTLPMPVERMVAHPNIRQDAGQIALQRGPVVYCLEGVENGDELANVVIPQDAHFTTTYEPDLFGGVTVISGEALRPAPIAWSGSAYAPASTLTLDMAPFTFKAIPYAFWANREPGEMRVWLRQN